MKFKILALATKTFRIGVQVPAEVRVSERPDEAR